MSTWRGGHTPGENDQRESGRWRRGWGQWPVETRPVEADGRRPAGPEPPRRIPPRRPSLPLRAPRRTPRRRASYWQTLDKTVGFFSFVKPSPHFHFPVSIRKDSNDAGKMKQNKKIFSGYGRSLHQLALFISDWDVVMAWRGGGGATVDPSEALRPSIHLQNDRRPLQRR